MTLDFGRRDFIGRTSDLMALYFRSQPGWITLTKQAHATVARTTQSTFQTLLPSWWCTLTAVFAARSREKWEPAAFLHYEPVVECPEDSQKILVSNQFQCPMSIKHPPAVIALVRKTPKIPTHLHVCISYSSRKQRAHDTNAIANAHLAPLARSCNFFDLFSDSLQSLSVAKLRRDVLQMQKGLNERSIIGKECKTFYVESLTLARENTSLYRTLAIVQ